MLSHPSPLQWPAVLSQGWTALTLLLLMMITLVAQRNGFTDFSIPTGTVALNVLSVVCATYVLMSVLTRLSQGTGFRWLNAGLTVLATALAMGHQAHGLLTGISASGICGSSTQGLFEVLRTTHHAIGILMSVLAVRWALAARKADAQ